MTYNLLYMGSPDFAVAPLKALIEHPKFNVVAVLTKPDKPEGRGQKLRPTPVKKLALENEIEVIQPKSLKKIILEGGNLSGSDSADQLMSLGKIHASIVVAYGKIIPKSLIDYPEFGAINIHPSLLPRWRGAAPIQHALFAGDEKTGTCIMQLDEGLDTGPVYSKKDCPISPEDDFGSLHDKLSIVSTELLVDSLPKIFSGELAASKQDEAGVTYAEKWDVEDQTINWSESAKITNRRVRTCTANKGARAQLNGEIVKIHKATEVENPELSQRLGWSGGGIE